MRIGCGGQALIEGSVGIAVVAVFFAVSVPLLQRPWERFRCVHALFEETHRFLVGAPRTAVGAVSIREDGEWVVGRVRCVGRTETVRFRKLEP